MRVGQVKRAVVAGVVPVVVGVVVGAAWVRLAEPWYWTVTDGRLSMGEAAAAGQFRAVALFIVLGVPACAVWGLVVALASRSSWLLVPFMVAGSLAAALVAWQYGLRFGPPDPSRHAASLSQGDKVAARLVIDSVAPFLLWPAGALAGLLAGTLFGPSSTAPRHARDSEAAGTRR